MKRVENLVIGAGLMVALSDKNDLNTKERVFAKKILSFAEIALGKAA